MQPNPCGWLGCVGAVTLLQQASHLLGRPVNPSIYPLAEFASKLASGQRFLKTVFADKKLFVIGGLHDLGSATASEARPEDSD